MLITTICILSQLAGLLRANTIAAIPAHSLWEAVDDRDLERVKYLLSHGYKPSAEEEFGQRALEFAAFSGSHEICAELMKHGMKPNASSLTGSTPLNQATYGGDIRIVKAFLQEGASVNRADGRGETPIHAAAESGRADLLRLFLQYHPIIGQANVRGQTALHMAVNGLKPECVTLLLQAGWKQTRDARGVSPFDRVQKTLASPRRPDGCDAAFRKIANILRRASQSEEYLGTYRDRG